MQDQKIYNNRLACKLQILNDLRNFESINGLNTSKFELRNTVVDYFGSLIQIDFKLT